MSQHRRTATANDESRDVHALEQLMRAQLEDFRELRACLERKRTAIRTADLQAIESVTEAERRIVQRCGQREPQRRGLLDRSARALGLQRPAATVGDIAEAVAEPQRTRLVAAAAELRETAAAARRESAVARQAAESLSQHLAGIMQTMQSALGRAPLYGQRGRLDGGAPLQFNVDVRS